MTYHGGSAEKVVRDCIQNLGPKENSSPLTPCARLGVELVANQNPDCICLQEIPSAVAAKNWVKELNNITKKTNPHRNYIFGMHPSSYEKSSRFVVHSIVVWDAELFGEMEYIPSGHDARNVAFRSATAKTVVASVHVSRGVDIKNYLENFLRWGGDTGGSDDEKDNVVVMGDFNDYNSSLFRKQLDLWGKKLELRNPEMQTCCADQGSDYPYPGDYVFSDRKGTPKMVEDFETKTSDHKAVVFTLK